MASGTDFPFNIMDVASLLRLNIRRRSGGRVAYADCPICGDRRGKLGLYPEINTWRCYHCGECGGMLALYGKAHGVGNSQAYQEICEALMVGSSGREYTPRAKQEIPDQKDVPQTQRASPQEIHNTLTALLAQLTLSPAHREHLRAKRGLTDGQIGQFGFKSTPPGCLCRTIAARLIKQGRVVEGVPGFYTARDGTWTMKFFNRTSGIVIPLRGVDGLLQGLQIRLDHPIKKEGDPPGKPGIKYLPFDQSWAGFEHELWAHEYSGHGPVTLSLHRDFLSDDPAGQRLLLHWVDEYFFTMDPKSYFDFVQAVLEDEAVAALLTPEDQRGLFEMVISQGDSLPAYVISELKQRYQTPEEQQAEREAAEAAEIEEARRKREQLVERIEKHYQESSDGTFGFLVKYLNKYRYFDDQVKIARRVAYDGLEPLLQGCGYTLTPKEADHFLNVCGNLISGGALDWAEFQSHIGQPRPAAGGVPPGIQAKDQQAPMANNFDCGAHNISQALDQEQPAI